MPLNKYIKYHDTNDGNDYRWSGTEWILVPSGTGGMEIHGNEYHNPDYITLDAVYPVGSVYLSVNSVNPGTLFGGSWVAFGAGRVLIGVDASDPDFNTVEKTGGAKTVQSSAQSFAGTPSTAVVNHTHAQSMPTGFTGTQAYLATDTSTTGTKASPLSTGNPTGGVSSYTPSGTNTPGSATSVVQPYITVYCWKRTA